MGASFLLLLLLLLIHLLLLHLLLPDLLDPQSALLGSALTSNHAPLSDLQTWERDALAMW